jgi:F0F1-type ATP synthase membrane subunit c/vacuolar-type H+-ATPase subunit K
MGAMDPKVMAYFAAGIGAGLTIIGGAAGIGCLAAAAMDGFFSLIICILLAIK